MFSFIRKFDFLSQRFDVSNDENETEHLSVTVTNRDLYSEYCFKFHIFLCPLEFGQSMNIATEIFPLCVYSIRFGWFFANHFPF